jgi:hypothetical protein
MRERFFSCIDALCEADTKPDGPRENRPDAECIPGFSVVALCCLVVETLQSFIEDSPGTINPAEPCTFPQGNCIKPSSGTNQLFIKFLRRPSFGEVFNGDVAKYFVYGLRNGILHEAETRKWVIWREEPATMVAPEDDGFALNRTLFYAAVKQEFENYLAELRNPSNEPLRRRFKKKMDDLCKET